MNERIGPTSVKPKWRRRFLAAAAAMGAGLITAIIGFQAAVAWLPYPSDTVLAPQRCTWIEDRDGNALAAFVPASNQWNLPLAPDQISPHLLDAIIAIEDRRFYAHHGVDWKSAAGAIWQGVLGARLHRGASTLTMQLYRLSHPAHRSVWSKLLQAIRAQQIERHLSKHEILVDYLNAAPFGGNLVGAGAASWRYFGRPCHDLTLGEAALLAALPQNPNALRPDRSPARAIARRNRVLDDMLTLGMIDRHQHDEAIAEPIEAKWHLLPQENNPSDSEESKSANPRGLLPLLVDLAKAHPATTIHTTIDPQTQAQSATLASVALGQFVPSHITAAAIVVLDTQSARCLASVSLSTVQGTQLIDLTHRPRSSGSTLKPFIYATAFDQGICTPQSLLNDAPTSWAGYTPQDYDRQFTGPLSAADALAQSRNIPAMAVLAKVGIDRAVGVMASMGLQTLAKNPAPYGLPLAIGGADVTLMELAEASATLARGGDHRQATILTSSPPPSSTPDETLRPESCLAALHCLADPDRTESVCPSALPLSPAWKTGTSSGHRDAWCAAVTPRRTVVVWLGNADGTASDALVGQESAAPLALKILVATDPGGPGFDPPPSFRAGAQVASATFSLENDNISMISPAAGQEIVPDPSLPPQEQRISLRATAPGRQMWWFVDGQCLGKCANAEPMWWTPTPGDHEIRVVAENGRAAEAEIKVR